MKVAFVSGSYPPIKCGVGDYTACLCAALRRQGLSTSIITSTGVSAEGEGQGLALIPAVESWGWGEKGSVLGMLARQQVRLANVQYPTQRYGRSLMVNLLPYSIRRSLKIPVVYTVHEYGSYTLLGRLRILVSAALSSAVIVPDRENLAQMGRALPALRPKLKHLPLGPNIMPVRQPGYDRQLLRSRYGATKDTLVLSYFGFLSPSKGLETLLGALEILGAEQPNLRWRLLLIADRRPADDHYAAYHHRIERLLETHRAMKRVYWTGYSTADEVSEFLSSSDLCILPFADGATLRRTTLLSALCHGLPVVSTIPPGKLDPELRGEENIMLVKPGDPAALAQRIAELAGDEGRRRELALGALRLSEQFSWERIGRDTVELFQRLVHPDAAEA